MGGSKAQQLQRALQGGAKGKRKKQKLDIDDILSTLYLMGKAHERGLLQLANTMFDWMLAVAAESALPCLICWVIKDEDERLEKVLKDPRITPAHLHVPLWTTRSDAMRDRLVEMGADPNCAASERDGTVRDVMCRDHLGRQRPMVAFLLRHRAEAPLNVILAFALSDGNHQNALHVLVKARESGVALSKDINSWGFLEGRHSRSQRDLLLQLTEELVRLKDRDNEETIETALHYAARDTAHTSLPCLALLLRYERFFSVMFPTTNVMSPAHHAHQAWILRGRAFESLHV